MVGEQIACDSNLPIFHGEMDTEELHKVAQEGRIGIRESG